MANEIKQMSYFDVEQNKNLNLKTKENVDKTIDELKASVFDDINYFESEQSDAGKAISDDERLTLSFWSFTIDKLLGKIPAEVKQACMDKLNELKDLFTTICKKNRTIEHNGKNIEYKNGQTTLLNTAPRRTTTQDTSATAEPNETDSEVADSWNTHIKNQAYAYMKELDKKTKDIKDDLKKVDIALELQKDYLDGIEDPADIKLFNDYCNEYRNNKKVIARNQGRNYT